MMYEQYRTSQLNANVRNLIHINDIKKSDEKKLPIVSIIVATLGRKSLKKCLDALYSYDYPAYEIIVIYDIKKEGAGCARNKGLEIAKGTLIHFIDDDAIASADNLKKLVRAYLKLKNLDPMVGGVQGVLLPVAPWGTSKAVTKIELTSKRIVVSSFDGTGMTDHVNTCNAIFPTYVLREVGGFDEEISYKYDDVDLSYKIRARGHNLYAIPDAKVEHLERKNREDNSFRSYLGDFYSAQNAILLYWKWQPHYACIYTLRNLFRRSVSLFVSICLLPIWCIAALSLRIRLNWGDLLFTKMAKLMGCLSGIRKISYVVRNKRVDDIVI